MRLSVKFQSLGSHTYTHRHTHIYTQTHTHIPKSQFEIETPPPATANIIKHLKVFFSDPMFMAAFVPGFSSRVLAVISVTPRSHV